MKYTYHPYQIRCLTNLHAGSNGESHAIIDKTVQRDVATGLPTIFSSSMKGALREHFEAKFGEDDPIVLHIFGPKPKREEGDEAQGKYRFFSANLLWLPVRSNVRPFFLTTCPAILHDFKAANGHFKLRIAVVDKLTGPNSFSSPLGQQAGIVNHAQAAILEDELVPSSPMVDALLPTVGAEFEEHLALLKNDLFMPIVQRLPVIARNQLENGISQNLWYEEVVPRQTRFYTFFGIPDGDPHQEAFVSTLKELIQIGGNATIGYGQTRFSPLTQTPANA